MSFQKQILFKELIKSSPVNSTVAVNLSRESHISVKDFLVLFPNENPERDQLLYYLQLNQKTKKYLLELLDSDFENVLKDFTHFDIKAKDKVIARSYNMMKWAEIIPSYFPSIQNNKDILFDEIEIASSNRII